MDKNGLCTFMNRGSVSDFNDCIESGIYSIAGYPSNTPVSGGSWGILAVFTNYYTLQIYCAYNDNGAWTLWARLINSSGGSFEQWKKL